MSSGTNRAPLSEGTVMSYFSAAADLRRRWLAVLVLSAAQVMIVLDQNIVNVALPAIRDDLGLSPGNLVWTVNAYVIPFGGLLLLAGRLGDLISRKYVFLAGLALFSAASLWAGSADDQTGLLLARFVQGVGGAVTSAGLLGMVVTSLPEPRHRARAIGVFGFASAGGGALGTVVGGVLTDALSWHWIFFINVPIGVVVGVMAWRLLPVDRGVGVRAGADVVGAVLVTAGVVLGVYALINAESQGWGSAVTLGGGAVSVVLLTGFALRQRFATTPLVPTRVLRSRNVVGANLVQALMVGALFGFMFFTVLHLQQVLGFSPLIAGLAFLPAPAVIAVVSMTVAPRLMHRFGARRTTLTGLPILAAGFVMLAQVSPGLGYEVSVGPAMVVMAFGFGITMPSLMSLAMSDVAAEDSGVTSGLFNTTQQVGGAVGLAVLSTLVGARTEALRAEGVAEAAALAGGYRAAFWLGGGFVAVAWLIAGLLLRAAPAGRESRPVATPA
ncbi:MFS transporter [Stackebrandtia albiflava]